MSRERSIIIIGAGIAGLSAGCYGQMNGYRTRIFELHNLPGGLCTGWKRRDYTFDGCLHWLVGSGEGTALNRVWQELGALPGRRIVDHDEYVRVEAADGRTFICYADIDRLEQHLKELAPADSRVIGQLCRAMRRGARFGAVQGRSPIHMLPYIPLLMKYSRISIEQYVERFSDPFLREALRAVFDMPDMPMIGLILTLGWMHNRDAGYPIGGSLEFSRAIEARYRALGGEIHYRSRVERILVEDDGAVGVRLADGSEHRADVVISAADGHATIFEMLEGKYVDETIQGYYDRLPTFPPLVQVSLGVARDLTDEPHSVVMLLDDPVTIAGEQRDRIMLRHLSYDPTMAPAGKAVIEVMLESDHAYWAQLAQDEERYDAEKKDAAIKVMQQLERRFPGLESQVEVVDVATPLTYERFTGNWKGSMEGWLLTTETARMMVGPGMRKTLPGLENFYMCGQWVEPGGGVPTAAMSARRLIATICKRDDRKFAAHP